MKDCISFLISIFLLCMACSTQAQYQIRTDEKVKYEKEFRHQIAQMNRISSVKVFINNDTPVVAAEWLLNRDIVLTYNLDALVEIENSVNEMLMFAMTRKYGNKLDTMSEKDKMNAYSAEFNLLLNNSDSLRNRLTQLEKASASHLLMYAFQIKALPAFVINDDTVLYGYSSINEALEKYFSVD